MGRRPRWQSWLPEPFWPTPLALLLLSFLAAVPFAVVAVLIWPSATGTDATLLFVGSYVLALPVTSWLFRERRTR